MRQVVVAMSAAVVLLLAGCSDDGGNPVPGPAPGQAKVDVDTPDLRALRQEAGVEKARVVVYHRPRQYRATYYAEAQPLDGGLLSAGALSALTGPGPKFLYLWMP